MAQTFDATYWTQESALYWQPHPRLRFMAKLLSRLPQRRLLDIGCSGAALRELLPASFVYFGCDLSDEAARRLPEGHFLQCDFNETTNLSFFNDKAITAIHVGGVLEYLRQPEQLLIEARKLVSAGAPLVLSLINFQSAHYSQLRTHHAKWIYRPGLHTLMKMMRSAGWSAERIWPFTEKNGLRRLWLRTGATLFGVCHPWTRRRARQFILLARAV